MYTLKPSIQTFVELKGAREVLTIWGIRDDEKTIKRTGNLLAGVILLPSGIQIAYVQDSHELEAVKILNPPETLDDWLASFSNQLVTYFKSEYLLY